MALYFECQIKKNALLQTVLGDFAHWVPDVVFDDKSKSSDMEPPPTPREGNSFVIISDESLILLRAVAARAFILGVWAG